MKFIEEAERYAAMGFKVFPLRPGTKEPFGGTNGVHDATNDMSILSSYAHRWPDANIAVACGPDSGAVGTIVIDVDKHHGGIDCFQALLKKRGALPACPMSKTPQGGYHLFFRHYPRITNSQNKLCQGIDIRSTGGAAVLPPSHWDGRKKGERVCDGGDYRWVRQPLGSHLPAMPQWMLKRLLPKPMPKLAPKQWDKSNADLVQAEEALKFIANHDYETWTKTGMALKAEFGDEAFDLWCSWSSAGYSKFDPKECRQKWRSFRRGDGVRIGSVFHAARVAGADLKKIFAKHGGLAA